MPGQPLPRTEDGFTFSLYGAKSGKPENLLVIFHGHGSNLGVWHDRAVQLREEKPDADVIVLQGPLKVEKDKDAYGWLPITDSALKIVRACLSHAFGLLPVARDINSFLDKQLAKRNLGPENCGLIGNSIGAIVALQAAFHSRKPYGGVLAYSGAVLPLTKVETKPPLCVLMGGKDGFFNAPPPLRGVFAKAADKAGLRHPHSLRRLKEQGVIFTEKFYPDIGHELSDYDPAWAAGNAFLFSALKPKP